MAYISFQPKDYFNTTLWTGTGAENAITGVGFQPDWVWVKRREIKDHNLYDAVRGTTKFIESNTSDAEATDAQTLKSFDSDGFTLGTSTNVNANAGTYASWNWKAGTTSGISAGSQTITPSSYSINTTAGFGIYKWSRTGSSFTDYFSHGLGVTPTIALQKRTDGVQDWYVNTTVIDGTNDNLHLNKTDVKEDDSTTVATSTNYYPKSPETGDYITYLFAPIKGFSKFGSYTGNGNADGTFIYTGFKPAMVIIKLSSTGSENWRIFDNKRIGYNPSNYLLYPSGSFAEDTTGSNIDFLSNGFKLKETNAGTNGSGNTYIYMAFAEAPLVSSNDIPATAR